MSLMVRVKFYSLCDKARVPKRAREDDACYDVYTVEDMNISPRETTISRLGFKVAIPRGWEIQIRPRSGLALSRSLTVLNSPGTLDSGYRGEVGVILHNSGMAHVFIPEGTRIAQLALKRVHTIEFVEMTSEDALGETSRGEGGFGSTGD